MPSEAAIERRPPPPTPPTQNPTNTTKGTHTHMGILPHAAAAAAAAADQDPLPCPRCDSTNTKFCYYNNYNFSQPRHFCKSCRRYWTHGGTLRDIPVGGGSRRNAKRSRTTLADSSSPSSFSGGSFSSSSSSTPSPTAATATVSDPIPSTPLFVSVSGAAVGSGPYLGFGEVMMKPTTVSGGLPAGGFTSLLTAAGPCGGLMALGGFGLGLGPSGLTGLDEVGFGLGKGVWAFQDVGYLGGGGGPGRTAAAGVGCGGGGGRDHDCGGIGEDWNTWQLESGGGGGGGGEDVFIGGGGNGPGGECFSSPVWPELAISTPGNGLK